jgi:signal transduction histidine kinase
MVALRHEIEGIIAAYKADAEAKGLDLRAAFPDSLPPVRGDTVRVRQVLNNILSNAVKFTSDGYIEISTAAYKHDGRSWVRCAIEDTGIGITPKDQQIIFDEFRQVDGSTTREYGGTGLGLAITKKLIEMMGGRLWVESEGVVGKGSTFVFELPVELEPDARRTGGAQ